MPSRSSPNLRLLLSLALAAASCGCAGGGPDADWDACQQAVERGAVLERDGKYPAAEREYLRAEALDPQDPVPQRYLGELYRHQFGDWDKAKMHFRRVLELTGKGTDPLSRAVALHGLGKMTVWEGRFEEGLKLMEQSAETFPTALCCRNLAIYWMAEEKPDHWKPWADAAMALEPEDPYNQVFWAVCLDLMGKCKEAQATAAAAPFRLEQCYNRACIKAMCGFPEEALALLKRHFYEFETTDAVRMREMKEARSDVTLKSLFKDPRFLELTRLAEAPGVPPVVPPASMR